MIKKLQMRWNRWSVRPFLDIGASGPQRHWRERFRRRYPDFRPANDDTRIREAA
jgi:hypothetical protein